MRQSAFRFHLTLSEAVCHFGQAKWVLFSQNPAVQIHQFTQYLLNSKMI